MDSGDGDSLLDGSSSEECSGDISDLDGSLSSEGVEGERRLSSHDMPASTGPLDQRGGASRPRAEADSSRAGDPHRAAVHRGDDGRVGAGLGDRSALGPLTTKERKLRKELADLPAWASDPNRDIAKPKSIFELVSEALMGWCWMHAQWHEAHDIFGMCLFCLY